VIAPLFWLTARSIGLFGANARLAQFAEDRFDALPGLPERVVGVRDEGSQARVEGGARDQDAHALALKQCAHRRRDIGHAGSELVDHQEDPLGDGHAA
jgi:hypothetical protein